MDKITLYCLPYAGGSSAIYSKWKRLFGTKINICPLELPGRGRRLGTPLLDNIEEITNDIYNMIKNDIDRTPYAFFGHSMGSTLTYEIVHKLIAMKHRTPIHLFFSGKSAPHVYENDKMLHTLPEEKFKEEIFKLGGTPKELLEHKELLEFCLPILRADLTAIETYNYVEKNRKLACDLTILNGIDDNEIKGDLNEWKLHTKGSCKIYNFEGGHFFINEYTDEIIEIINTTLTQILKI